MNLSNKFNLFLFIFQNTKNMIKSSMDANVVVVDEELTHAYCPVATDKQAWFDRQTLPFPHKYSKVAAL